MNRGLKFIIIIVFLLTAQLLYAQQPVDSIVKKLDSLERKTDSAGGQVNAILPENYNAITKLSARDYAILLGSNLKQGFTKPFHMTGKDWGRLGLFLAADVGIGVFDEKIQQGALRLRNRSAAVRNTGKYISSFGGVNEVVTLVGLHAYGMVFKKQKMKTTTLLASQAYITGAVIESVIKTLTGRTRPNYYGPLEEAEPRFTGPFGNTSKDANGKKSNSSFPSGHTTVAFAAATVYAKEYANKPWVGIVAYSAAGLIGVSRITENKHWATDVFTGAALGYLVGRQVVNNYHRFARIKYDSYRKKMKVSFFINRQFGQTTPGLIARW